MPAKKKGSCKREHSDYTTLAISETKSKTKVRKSCQQSTNKIEKISVQTKASEPASKPKATKRTASKALSEEAPVQIKKLNLEPLETLFTDTEWTKLLQPEFHSTYWPTLASAVDAEYISHTVYPSRDQLFNAFNTTPFRQVKVLVLGQDPYHEPGQAHGLSFSVPRAFSPLPGSLRNMYKALEQDVPGFKAPTHGCLEAWARRGVLLLNATLTVQANAANSHAKLGWQHFTDRVIELVAEKSTTPVVFVLLGGFAQKKASIIAKGQTRGNAKHVVLQMPHPSPICAGGRPFLEAHPFRQIDEACKKAGITPIDWTLE